MKTFVKDETQMENVEKFKKALGQEGFDLFLWGMSLGLEMNLETMKNITVDGVILKDSDIYKTHSPVFIEIGKKHINAFNLLDIFGIDKEQIFKLKERQDAGEKIPKDELFKVLGYSKEESANLDKGSSKEDILKPFVNKVTPELNKEMIKRMYFTNDELNVLLNSIEDYNKVDTENKKNDNKVTKEFISLNLYAKAVEIYLKILKEIYSKLENINVVDINNGVMYQYFQKHYPILWDSNYNKLRNDVCHSTYEVRGDYTFEQIDEIRNTVILKAFTGLVAKNIAIVDFFKSSVNIDGEKVVEQMLKLFE